MGSSCHKSAKRTQKIPIRPKLKVQESEPEQQFPQLQVSGCIGQYFQYKYESQTKEELQKKTREWQSIIDDKLEEFKNLEIYIQLKEVSQNQPQQQIKQEALPTNPNQGGKPNLLQNEIVDFMNLAQNEEQSDQESARAPQSQPSQTNSQPQNIPVASTPKKKSKQETLLENLFKAGQCSLKEEKEILLYIFSQSEPQRFNQLLKQGLPFDIRWSAWKVRFHEENEFDPNLYSKLLNQTSPHENSIDKDIGRTFPRHQYFLKDEATGQSLGQTQLFRVLKALAIQFPVVGYCQGMNYLVGFLLITNGGNDDDVFWILKNMFESSEFMLTGMFEEKLPLMYILIDLFKQEFQSQIPDLYQHFEEQLIPESLYAIKWITTLFVYSFPFNVIYRLWDYILAKNILSVISICLAILDNYKKLFLEFDIGDISQFFRNLNEQQDMLTDTTKDYYLDINKVLSNSETRYQISPESLKLLRSETGADYLIGLHNMQPRKKFKQVLPSKQKKEIKKSPMRLEKEEFIVQQLK